MKLPVSITTKSNLFIGGSPTAYEIGGIDSYTVTDYEENPYIPGSSFKGALRHSVKQLENSEAYRELTIIYQEYLKTLIKEAKHFPKIEQEQFDKMNEKVASVIQNASAEYVFGIEGFNQTPKLLFSDMNIKKEANQPIFSIDSKNSVRFDQQSNDLSAVPRTYKTVCPNVTFKGSILFQNINKLEEPDKFIQLTITLLEECFQLFNEGFHRLGNSGSRGYGRVEIIAAMEDMGHV
ncbi:RAMP superfamily CRISPR-associated protein [Enterococcus sp. AZ126]|uniref:RAMP superfamily CRISPR-associated protein n=1 Tax=Enterococcus sp. AZ126 TaxID=2774635 RepID=UPI003F234DB9